MSGYTQVVGEAATNEGRVMSNESIRWLPNSASPANNPHMTEAFARVYERAARKITGPVARAALDHVAPVGRGTRLLDIAAGAGALSLPAAERGAMVTAIDIAPGMAGLLAEKLAHFKDCEVRQMDGQALHFDSGSFDVACSIFGVTLFPDWRQGLSEQARVLRSGGLACVANWRDPTGGSPFRIMAQALRSVFPDRPQPAPTDGVATLADPDRLIVELQRAGLVDIVVYELEAGWEGPAGDAYLEEMSDLHAYMGPYATLDAAQRARVDEVIVSLVNEAASNGVARLSSPVVIGVGVRA